MKKKLLALLTALLLVILAACGGAKNASYDAPRNGAPAMEAPSSAPTSMEMMASKSADGAWYGGSESTGGADVPANPYGPDVKMIYRAALELESTEFDTAAGDIETLVEQLGGYFEERSVRNYSSGYRYANYTVRVPADKFKSFLSQVGDLCHVVYQTQSAENITEQYYDTDSRLQTAKIKLERLQDLLAKADNMADIITLESAISDTEYQIESLSGTLRHYDALVGFSTINIDLKEVYRLTEVEDGPQTFGERFASAFKSGLSAFGETMENLAIWLAYHWLGLVVAVAVVVLVVKLIRRKGKGFHLPRRKKGTPTDGSNP